MKKYSKPGMLVLALAVIVFFVAILGGVRDNDKSTNSNYSDAAQNASTPHGIWLTDMDYSDSSFRIYVNRTTYDSESIGYKHFLTGSGNITYPLHRLYSSLSGRWEVNINQNNSEAEAGTLCIYVDDRLAYSSSAVSIADIMYEDIFVDLSGADQLRIEFGYDGNHGMFHDIWLEPYTSSSVGIHTKPQADNVSTHMNQPSSLSIRNVPAYIDCMDYKGYRITDQYGNEYTDYYSLMAYNDKSDNRLRESSIVLRPLGNWHYLRGRYFPHPNQNEGFLIRFQIFADNVLIYDSGLIDRNVGPVDFDLDINYASSVRIQSHSDDYTFMGSNTSIILVNAEVHN